jgi:quercetin dioxygenase-like cupin family protein
MTDGGGAASDRSHRRKEEHMQRKLMWAIGIGAVIMSGTYAGSAMATPPSGFVSTTLALGRVGEIDVDNLVISDDPDPSSSKKSVWHSLQKTKGASDLYVQSNVWAAGGTSGWHTHPGHSLITVTAGAVTAYEGGDPSCTPKVYTAGMTFVDPGGDHVHVLRNETAVEARTITVQLIPAGAPRRIDAAGSAGCPF